MDQQSEALQLLREIRADIRAQVQLTERMHERAETFRDEALQSQKKAMTQQKRAIKAIALFSIFLGAIFGAILSLMIFGRK